MWLNHVNIINENVPMHDFPFGPTIKPVPQTHR